LATRLIARRCPALVSQQDRSRLRLAEQHVARVNAVPHQRRQVPATCPARAPQTAVGAALALNQLCHGLAELQLHGARLAAWQLQQHRQRRQFKLQTVAVTTLRHRLPSPVDPAATLDLKAGAAPRCLQESTTTTASPIIPLSMRHAASVAVDPSMRSVHGSQRKAPRSRRAAGTNSERQELELLFGAQPAKSTRVKTSAHNNFVNAARSLQPPR
jgi:hypothetical protein